MLDINFYMKGFDLKKQLMNGEKKPHEYVFAKMEEFRSKVPVIYNIETTNACNMVCEMCPRTKLMTRSISSLDLSTFEKVVKQLRSWSKEEWNKWESFVEKSYRVSRDDMSENHFFLYVIPKVIVLHGYGDPLLDKDMGKRVRIMHENNLLSYFSCNPSNIDIDKTVMMFENGLTYIKYSIESVDDGRHKTIRGEASNFTKAYKKICRLLEIKKKHNYETKIIITMLNLNKPEQDNEFHQLKDTFKGLDVYIYLKSQDQQWYEDKDEGTESVHWTEFCQFPWSSMTIKSNGESASCVEDYNNEIILGDVHKESLYDIWNGKKYHRLREDHFNLTPCIKCTERCDMKLIGSFTGNQELLRK